jgi:hypothetical protein
VNERQKIPPEVILEKRRAPINGNFESIPGLILRDD